ncbi:cytochrome c oxidase subunit 2A [Bacillus sp. DJP31]|uniref:cytochrome c oxidase subunit 2A n=1 Tax=Bacillus sp. DJP31 TaxID=3409789 RepID=UPI003BB555F0
MQPSVKKDTPVKVPHEKESNLKGTFVSVLLLGAFIVLSWITVYALFIQRL